MTDIKEYLEDQKILSDYHDRMIRALQAIETAKKNARQEFYAYNSAFMTWWAKRQQQIEADK